MKLKIIILSIAIFCASCNYLDVVPDNVATLDNAFNMRNAAEKYLFTCYSWVPNDGLYYGTNPGFTAGDEMWFLTNITDQQYAWRIATGNQNVVNPLVNFWSGEQGGVNLYRGIRECNIFLENIQSVPDMPEWEKALWSAEVKFLKAYYHFHLLRMYGPIPLMRENMPISASVAEVKSVLRNPVDECFDYVVELLDEAAAVLPNTVQFDIEQGGRATKPIALTLKAYVLVTAASPLFNGNTDYANYKDPNGQVFFNQTDQPEKWQRAADACREAIELCHDTGHELYKFHSGSGQNLSTETIRELSLRNPLTQKWNSEQIWTNTQATAGIMQSAAQAKLVSGSSMPGSRLAPPLKIAEVFYTKNGVPINEDTEYEYNNRYTLRRSEESDRLYLKPGEDIPVLHFDRESRFYAFLGFDQGRWYGGAWNTDDEIMYVDAKAGGIASSAGINNRSATGYWPKKIANYLNTMTSSTSTTQNYPWPTFRLADLYLLYAEALNEVGGPSDEVYEYLDLIRERAGLPTVEDAWTNHSTQATKHTTQLGLREIIHQERMIELMFEGKRWWDLKRWKKAPQVLNQPITGWDIYQEEAVTYYRVRVVFNQEFRQRDYFWPIKESELLVNRNLVQSPGW
ncbi:RagB/SusD family nutrient uptake outer membrane protein [Parapedobacter tibetensis]|uniref:RagB/SusD family nutrient uptake outer membrane protein n=1 Tax=Parapedobacter tibetensis TaxID=2972951 RepID=UPI00214D9A02|nr:RagB/SusD family nutrient uptake outer membrane protein [Parapedobacter tibetensis]